MFPVHPVGLYQEEQQIGTYALTVVKSALRTQAGWDSMTAPEQAVYAYHFETLSAWEAAIPEDLVTLDEKWIVECYNDWLNGIIGNITISKNVTSAINSMDIISAYGQGHQGDPNTGAYLTSTNASIINIQRGFVNIQNISLDTKGISNVKGVAVTLDGIANIDRCILKNTESDQDYSYSFTEGCTFSNSLVLNTGYPIYATVYTASNLINNVLVVASATKWVGFDLNNLNVTGGILCNSIAIGYSSDFSIRAAVVFSNCASSDATATGANSFTNIDPLVEFVDSANGDYHLAAGSQLIGAGLNLIENGTLTSPQYDLDGNQWPDTGPWDIGPYMYVDETPPSGGSTKIGGLTPSSVMLNSIAVSKIMKGANQVWPAIIKQVDLDGDGDPDSVLTGIAGSNGVLITQDSDSFNIDIDNDGNADIIIPKKH